MRTIFTTNAGPFTAYLLGYPQTEHHREDLVVFDRENSIPHTLVLLELFQVHGSETKPDDYYQSGNDPPKLGFYHLGFGVPDLPGRLQRLKEHGVSIVKDLRTATR
jgi:lactoylglutathione lyase